MDSNNSPPPQPGASAASNTAHTSPNNKTPTTLLSDPTFQLIHNAFLLGWSLMELRSRIQTMACILLLPRDTVISTLEKQAISTQIDSQSQSQAAQSQPQAGQNNPSASTPVNSPAPSQSGPQPQAATQTQSQDKQNNLLDSIESLLENVVLKDVALSYFLV